MGVKVMTPTAPNGRVNTRNSKKSCCGQVVPFAYQGSPKMRICFALRRPATATMRDNMAVVCS